MSFLARFSPIRAVRDLRLFLATREPYEMWFLIAAMLATSFVIYAFVIDSHFEKPYRPQITYVEQWRLDQPDAEIVARQKVDQAKRDKEGAARKAREDKLRAGFKRIDDKLNQWGI